MVLSLLLCLLHVQFAGVLSKLEFNTQSTTVSSKATPYSPSVVTKSCLLKPDMGPCRAKIRMYYYNTTLKNCTSFYWGGCQGNGNRYERRSECMKSCLSEPDQKPTQPRYCSLSFDYGYCFGGLKRWYYNRFWKICKETIYSGCGGNKNNFYNFNQCDKVCRLGQAPDLRATTEKAASVKKYLIINPDIATSKRGKNQVITTTKKPRITTQNCTTEKTTEK